jgi:hypothetical protein
MSTNKDVAAQGGMRVLTPAEVKAVAGGPGGYPGLGQQPNGQEVNSGLETTDSWRACPIVYPTS